MLNIYGYMKDVTLIDVPDFIEIIQPYALNQYLQSQ